MISQIYRGYVQHARLAPVHHAFRYPAFFFALDLDELPLLNSMGWLAGYNRPGVLSVRDEDHFEPRPAPIREKLAACLNRAGDAQRLGRVTMVTSARYFGHVFNPVSFFYCHREDGALQCLVAEVNNTFGERHVYVLRGDGREAGNGPLRYSAAKEFHVSPFNDLLGRYEFCFSPPGEAIDIRVDLIREGKTMLKTQMQGEALALSRGHLARTLLAYPLTAWLTIPRIHKQATRLHFARKLPFHPKPVPAAASTLTVAPPSLLDRAAMRVIFPLLEKIRVGGLKIRMPDGSERFFGDPSAGTPALLHVRDYRTFRRLTAGGDVGLGEAYTAGEWDTDNLPGLLQRLLENWHLVAEDARAVRVGRWLGWLGHLRRANTLRGSRKNIADHYDLGNDFFRLFLDETMLYSSAYYRSGRESLPEAQHEKIRLLVERADITAADHVLEIGCGWGGFAIEAARQTGCRVTAITISQQQFELARQRVREAGLEGRVCVELRDYRAIEGQFDKIVSVEMIEAVGHEQLGSFLARCDRALRPGGLVVLQAITIPHERYEAYRQSVDWIRKHIFPGGHLPSLEVLRATMERETSLRLATADDLAPHYARTLGAWRARFEAARAQLTGQGFGEAFQRKWLFYFALCEAAFRTRKLGLHHLVLKRSG